jgi:UDP-2,4-diacetamido-2,4,6-trideoxy-beta-L-altropyranose hydrolase
MFVWYSESRFTAKIKGFLAMSFEGLNRTDVVIRVDATQSMGIGHFMRCFAFAQWCRKYKINVIFVIFDWIESIKEKLIKENFNYILISHPAGSSHDINQTLTIANNMGASYILLDGYHFTNQYMLGFENCPQKLILIDDFGSIPDFVYAVINFQPWANSTEYSSNALKYLGLEYFMIREEFWPYANSQSLQLENHILIVMGGTDPHNCVMTLIDMIESNNKKRLHISVVVPDNSSKSELSNIKTHYFHDINFFVGLTDLSALMSKATVAITAGGGTCWELAFMNVPSLIIIQSENQVKVAEYMSNLGLGINLGWYDKIANKQLNDNLDILLSNQIEKTNLFSQMAGKTPFIFEHLKSTLSEREALEWK